jgi:hypothetical protein
MMSFTISSTTSTLEVSRDPCKTAGNPFEPANHHGLARGDGGAVGVVTQRLQPGRVDEPGQAQLPDFL